MDNLCLWQPNPLRMQQSNLYRFMAEVNLFHGLQLQDYPQLWQWSVEKITRFWPLVWQHCGVKGKLGHYSGGESSGYAAHPLVPRQTPICPISRKQW